MKLRGIVAVLALALMGAPAKAQETLGTGSLDTVLGYWGITSVSGTPLPSACTTGLVYSTATHLFSCAPATSVNIQALAPTLGAIQ